MKRRKFFKNTVKGALGATVIPIVNSSCSTSKEIDKPVATENDKPYGNTDPEQRIQMGTGKKPRPDRRKIVT